ncbi:MAG TPA: hypothetical protein VNH40_06530 [Gaiellaceae bacterium]|nr:hypothetical protein [Gaiellaceae bacterium]
MAKVLTGDGWRLELPDGLVAKPHKAWDYDSGAIARGWIGDAPVTVIVQTKQLRGGFNDWVRQVASHWLEQEPLRRLAVPGASDAVRIDGYVEFDGLGAVDDREQCIAVCAKSRRRAVALTIRSRPEDAVQAELEPIVDSFELVRPAGG